MSLGLEPKEVFAAIVATVSVVVSFASVAGALKAGVLKKIKFGSLELEASNEEYISIKQSLKKDAETSTKDVPFEIEQLANYYSQILSQSKTSFWFSLIFASLGFATIVIAAFLYTDANGMATVAQFIAGIIMDAVAGLFFVQSRNAQRSMGEFFDKLRKDRLHMESKIITEKINSEQAKDALRLHLSLHYAEVQNAEAIAKHITENCLGQPNIVD
ncbi:TRADD-N-associated membrane domain-containing protein [Aeromonas veronii]